MAATAKHLTDYRNREFRHFAVLWVSVLFILFSMIGTGQQMVVLGDVVSSSAGTQTAGVVWKRKNGYFYCYKGGKKLTGLQTISGKSYYFDSKGRQKTGWRKIGDKCHYFKIVNGNGGFLVTGKKINGISIDRAGTAQPTGATRNKLSLLLRYQTLSDKLVKPGATLRTRLMRAFLYARKQHYGVITDPGYSGRWDEILAAYFINGGPADCTVKAAGFAYLANALGAKKVTLRKYGHAHVEIGRRIYDPALANSKPELGPLEYFDRPFKELPRHAGWAWKNGPHRVI